MPSQIRHFDSVRVRTFSVSGDPMGKPRMTQRDKWAKRPCVLRYRAFKDKCRLHRVPVVSGCTVIFYLPMPESWSERKRTKMLGLPHRQKPDLDNLIKGLWDARVKKDEALDSVHAEKRWSSVGAIEVWVPPP